LTIGSPELPNQSNRQTEIITNLFYTDKRLSGEKNFFSDFKKNLQKMLKSGAGEDLKILNPANLGNIPIV